MRSALVLLATIVASAAGAAVDCDASYRCEYYFATSGGLTYWNFEPLCSQEGYTHGETDRNGTLFSFNICGLSPQVCPPSIPNSTLPSRGIAVQESGGTCYISGEGFPNFVPINPDNPATGGINITHEAAPEPAQSSKACANANDRIVSRSTKYMMLCDSGAVTIEVDAAYEEDECQYVIVMRSQYGCGAANNPTSGGNCLAPPQPPGLTADCSAGEVALSQATLGYEAEFQAWNQACLAQCDPTLATSCTADCQNHLGEYVIDCYSAAGTVYSFAQTVTFANGANVQITSYKCIASACGDGDINGFQAYAVDTQCSIVDTSKEMPTDCQVAVTPSGIQPAASATPSPAPSMCPSASAPPGPSKNPGPTTTAPPVPTPTAGPAPSGGDGGAVAGAIFATFAGLAVVVFGGYHIGTRSGYVRRESVPGSARFCLECGCVESIRRSSMFSGRRTGEAASFTSSSAVASAAAPVATSGFGSSGVGSGVAPSSGGGYQTI